MASVSKPSNLKAEFKHDLFREVAQSIGVKTWEFLTIDLQNLALDSVLIRRVFSDTKHYTGQKDEENNRIKFPLSGIFRDYSFLLAPAYKLFEGWVYLVAITSGIITVEQLTKRISVGALTDIKRMNNEYREMLEHIAESIKSPTIVTRWQHLYDTYSDFRNSPAHYGQVKYYFEEARDDISYILVTIRNTTNYLLESGIIFSEQNSTYQSVLEIPKTRRGNVEGGDNHENKNKIS